MKTTIDLVTTLYHVLNVSALRDAISGGLFNFDSRPTGSTKEDVVINSITVQDGIIQPGIANVNIHVPDIMIPNADGKTFGVPNVNRMRVILDIVKNLLGNDKLIVRDTTGFHISAISSPIKEEASNDHYINIRVSAEMHNQIY